MPKGITFREDNNGKELLISFIDDLTKRFKSNYTHPMPGTEEVWKIAEFSRDVVGSGPF